MSTNLTINGVTFAYPETGDLEWGADATNWASAVTSGALYKSGGSFTLAAEVDFGASYGLKSLYYKSRTADVASAGQIRLAVTDVISFKNNATDGDLDLGLDASDRLTFNSIVLADASTAETLTNKTLTSPVLDTGVSGTAIDTDTNLAADSDTLLASQKATKAYVDAQIVRYDTLTELTDTDITAPASANILVWDGTDSWDNKAVSGDITLGADGTVAIASDVIVNADVKTDAAIALSKLAALTADKALISSGAGVVAVSSVTATELGYVSGVTSSIQTQIGNKLTDPLTTDGDIIIRDTTTKRLAIGSTDQILKVSGGLPSWQDASGGGFGGGLIWRSDGDVSPQEDTAFYQQVFLFSQADIAVQKIYTIVKVPTSYLAGKQIKMKIGAYSPSTSNDFNLQTVATLIEKDSDALSDTTDQHTSTNADTTNSGVANKYREIVCDLTDGSGEVNSNAVAPGDVLLVQLSRASVAGTEDTADIGFLPSLTEVSFDGN